MKHHLFIFSCFLALALGLDNGVGRTPALGWSSWNYFEGDINQTVIIEIADALVSTGLREAGYSYLNLDAGVWLPNRTNTTGELQPDPVLFPDGIKPVADHLHGMKLKLGLYINLGTDTETCGRVGSYGNYEKDAATLAGWGVDYIKVDYCAVPGKVWTPPIPEQLGYWQQLRDAFLKTKRPIWLNFCPRTFGGSLVPPDPRTKDCLPNQRCVIDGPAHAWDAEIRQELANSILTEYHNSHDSFESAKSNLDALLALRPSPDATGPGFFSDGDMLHTCNFGGGKTPGSGMTLNEYQAQFALWAVLASPLILSADLRTVQKQHPDCLALLKNPEVLAVSQDPAANAPVLFLQQNGTTSGGASTGSSSLPRGEEGGVATAQTTAQGISRRMHDGSVAIVVLNRGDGHSGVSIQFTWEEVGMPKGVTCDVRDILGRQDRPRSQGYAAALGAHGAAFIRISNCGPGRAEPDR